MIGLVLWIRVFSYARYVKTHFIVGLYKVKSTIEILHVNNGIGLIVEFFFRKSNDPNYQTIVV